MKNNDLIQVQNLSKTYVVKKSFYRKSFVHAVKNVSFALGPGETLALVGESGSGKTTVGRIILKLTAPTSGGVLYKGQALSCLRGETLKGYRRAVQAVFQDPHASLNPRMRVLDIIAEPLRNFGQDNSRRQVESLLQEVGLEPTFADRFTHQLSGGQKQRIAIARALALRPEVVILDEPLSALDVTVQTHVLALLNNLQTRYGISFLLITHDLRAVRAIADRVAVMYKGELLEVMDRDKFVSNPDHPYTKALVSAMGILNITG